MGSLLTDTMMYGPVTLTAEVNGHGLDKNTITAQINVDIPQFYLSKYTYHNLTLDGNIDGQQFEGKVNLNDENAIINFEGLVNVTP